MSGWGGARRTKQRSESQCRLGNLWCGLPRPRSHEAGLKHGIKIRVLYEPDGTERVFCSGNCVEKWRPAEGEDALAALLGGGE